MDLETQIQKPRTVKLDFDLFKDLYIYAYRHSDADDLQYRRLTAGVQKKLRAMLHHDLYSIYIAGASEEERRSARDLYLDSIGLSDDFRWPDEADVHLNRGNPP